MSLRWVTIRALICLSIITFTAFWPSLFNGFIKWDDYLLLFNNPLITSPYGHHIYEFFSTIVGKTYIPLTTLSFLAEYHFFKLSPFIYHFDNLMLHTGVVILLFMICLQLRFSVRVSFLAAAFFSIHPMRVESVAWIAERKDVLYAFFYLFAVHQYLKYCRSNKFRFYIFSFLFFILSILSKSMAISLPLILFLFDWLEGREFTGKIILEKVPFLILSAVDAGIMFLFSPPTPVTGPVEAILIWAWTFVFYLKKFLFPFVLTPFYQLPQPVNIHNTEYSTAFLLFITVIFLLFYLRRNRLWLFACGYYFFSIFFLLRFNTAQEISIVADRFMYLPSLGFCLLIAFYLEHYWHVIKKRGAALKGTAAILAGLMVFTLAGKTFAQCKIWKDEFTFWTAVAKLSPHYLVYTNLGEIYQSQGKHDLAIEYYKKALGMNPDYDFWLYQNIGMVYLSLKDYDQALKYFNQSLILNPHCAEAYMLKASVYEAENEYDPAFENYSKAIQYNPDFAQAYHNRAIIYCRRGKLHEAIEDLTEAIRIIPDFLTAYYFRGQIYSLQGEKAKALADLDTALKIKPSYQGPLKYKLLLENNGPIPRILDIPEDTFDQPQWDPVGYKNYFPDKDRFYKFGAS